MQPKRRFSCRAAQKAEKGLIFYFTDNESAFICKDINKEMLMKRGGESNGRKAAQIESGFLYVLKAFGGELFCLSFWDL